MANVCLTGSSKGSAPELAVFMDSNAEYSTKNYAPWFIGMSKYRAISRTMNFYTPLTFLPYNAVITSSTDDKEVHFLLLPRFTSNEAVSSNF